MHNIGCCAPLDEDKIRALYKLGFRCFQLFVEGREDTSPEDTRKKYVRTSQELLSVFSDIRLYVHAPPWISLADGGKITRDSIKNMVHQLALCSDMGASGYVTHLGHRNAPWDIGLKNILKALREIRCKAGYDVPIFLENTPGRQDGSGMGSLKTIKTLIDILSSHRIKACFDTQHAWARGEDVLWAPNGRPASRDKLSCLRFSLEAGVGMIHLNANGPGVEFGSHVEDHDNTRLDDSYGMSPETLREIARMAEDLGLPVILERGTGKLLKHDIGLLRGWHG